MLFLALILRLAIAPNQPAVPAVQGDTPKPFIDNARVRVWDVRSATTANSLPRDPSLDSVVVSLEPASAAGRVLFRPKGVTGTTASGTDATHVVVIEVKDVTVAPIKNPSGYPTAFPRTGSRKIVDHDRLLVWDFSWTPGEPTRMHFHDKDVVVVYLETGDLRSTTPDNEMVVNHYEAGTIKFNPRDRVHTELLVAGKQRAIITELK
jgi:hypothetical protein